jgi:dihydroxy-acid dehydratase
MIIRYQGPSGAPGMPEMLAVSGALVGVGLGNEVPLITDGRFSGERRYGCEAFTVLLFAAKILTATAPTVPGASCGIMVGHVVPEAHRGGPIAHIRDGDCVVYNLDTRSLDVDISA